MHRPLCILFSIWLVALCATDLRSRRLPNVLTLGGAAVALVLHAVAGGGAGILDSLEGGLICAALLFVPFLLNAAGGGDVKMLFAVGCLFGSRRGLEALFYTSLAGLALGDEGAGLALYGWTASGWVALAGAPVAENEWIDWNATIDFTASPVTVTYGIGGTVLSNAMTGATALPVAGSPTSLRAVRYTGNGVVDDFRGVYYEPVAIVSIREPAFAETASSPMSLYTADGSQRLSLAVSVEGQPANAQYTAFTCPNLSPYAKDWTAAADSRPATAAETAAGAVDLDIPASADTLFVKLVVSDHDIVAGTKLSDL